tara:strand:+ start:2819 stop:3547 length:729 start_codon:yes stop_codon:yes gene_type:complete
MKVLLLAAGVGRRIGGEKGHPPKCLLKFNGKTLLHRHLELLHLTEATEVIIGVGFKAEMIQAELNTLDANGFASTIFNPRFEEGSNLTLWAAREVMTGDVLLMDADVLYDHRMLKALTNTSHRNCFLMDRDFEPGDEPVKLCVRNNKLIEFRKRIEIDYDFCGESVGFFRFDDEGCSLLMEACEHYTRQPDECYEEALREVMLNAPDGTFGYEDVTGLPWTEIDFPEDIEKARKHILPRLEE